MAKNKPSQPKQFDIHRTLPKHPANVTSYDVVGTGAFDDDLPKGRKRKTKRGFTWKRLVAGIFLLIFAFIIFIAAWDARNFSNASQKMFGSANLFDLVNSSSLKTDENGRVNILIVGYSADDPGHSGATLTDSILVLSMSTKSHTGYMLSIPRDLYVKIPGFGSGKINEVYNDGGISLLQQVINDDLDLQTSYYVIVNYGAVRSIVDALGGITINIQSPDPRGIYDPSLDYTSRTCCALANYPNGPVTLNGKQALNLTRARGDAYGSYGFPRGDYDRTQHQRQIFAAIKDRVTWKLLIDPRQNKQVFDAFANNIKTNIQLSEVRPLYGMFNKIPNQDLQSLSLDKINNTQLLRGATMGGLSYQVPLAGLTDYSQINGILEQINQR